MDTKHTPGPWEIDTATRPAEICTVHGLPPQGEEGQTFVYVRGALGYWAATPEENMANVRLIAASPDLLAALQDALKCFLSDHWHDHPTANEWRAVIAKATGTAA